MENEYINMVDVMESLPETLTGSIEQISYAGHVYIYGSESLGSEIKVLENKFTQYLDDWYQQAVITLPQTSTTLLTLRRLYTRLLQILSDDNRNLNLIDWKIAAYPSFIDTTALPVVAEYKSLERNAYRFFYECLSEQANSIDRVLQIVKGYIEAIDQSTKTEHPAGATHKKVLFFHWISDDINEFEELTKLLRSELRSDGFVPQETTLMEIRDLFNHAKRKPSTDKPASIRWLKPYISLSDFVKQLKVAQLVSDEHPSVYEIALNRFHNKDGVEFTPKKSRADNRPNLKDATQIDNIIALIRPRSTDALK